ncbi:hypothetical protein BB561_001879 [Smittium simulii]|uniref:Uncharacterized protein n=1 Tax=Smittium simulii TaxID=133385 RepID=A0A2T9YSJ8_9FUNG|nr:hypothetical protein BB561_001879 [Smittium simulii]
MRGLTFSAVLALVTIFQVANSEYADQSKNHNKHNQNATREKQMCAKLYGNGRTNFVLKSGDKCDCKDDGQFRCVPKNRAKCNQVKACINRPKNADYFKGYRGASCICNADDGSMYCYNKEITPVN